MAQSPKRRTGLSGSAERRWRKTMTGRPSIAIVVAIVGIVVLIALTLM